jgi:flagellar assembly factor FliW
MEANIQADSTTERALQYTTQFGEVSLREDKLISFAEGILGFADCTVFGLSAMPSEESSPFMLLQCVNDPEVVFLVSDPKILGFEYTAEDKAEALNGTDLDATTTEMLVILRMHKQDDADSCHLTANIKAPILIDSEARTGRQHIMTNAEYTTQQSVK